MMKVLPIACVIVLAILAGTNATTQRCVDKIAKSTCLSYKIYCNPPGNRYYRYMTTNCAVSCGFCCGDDNVLCKYWATNGQCQKNPTYMLQSCKQSCGKCNQGCVDKLAESTCLSYKKLGYCRPGNTYYLYMTTNCAVSCASCCQDDNGQCKNWANNGQCQSNPTYMLQSCKMSCGKCNKPTKKPAPKKTTPAPPKSTILPMPKIMCGVPTAPSSRPLGRIVGGIDSLRRAWPWHVAISYCKNCSTLPFCAGTLINNEWVVTAGHCIDGVYQTSYPTKPLYPLYVTLGDTNLDKWSGHEKIIEVRSLHLHENYGTNKAFDNDIALLRLSKPVQFTNNIRPACLPGTNKRLPAGTNCTVTGFGRTSEHGQKTPWLKQAIVPLVSESNCKKLLPSKISSSMLCAGYKTGRIDACKGDSGGPLVCRRSDMSWQLTGIVSWGIGCARNNTYGVYSDVQVLQSWIKNSISKNGNASSG